MTRLSSCGHVKSPVRRLSTQEKQKGKIFLVSGLGPLRPRKASWPKGDRMGTPVTPASNGNGSGIKSLGGRGVGRN